jgi:PIN domain nuclease of toxin-antitoxin system
VLVSDAAELYFSTASIWEVAIKTSLGRADFAVDARQLRRGLLSNGYLELPVTGERGIEVGLLPDVYKDPFDRILIVQSRVEGMRFVTADKLVAQYLGDILLV